MKKKILILITAGLSVSSCRDSAVEAPDIDQHDQQRYADSKNLEEFIQGTDPYTYWRKLTINSEPSDLYIVFDGKIIGKTPLTLNGPQMEKLGLMGNWTAYRGNMMWQSWDLDPEADGVDIKAPMSNKITNLEFRVTQEGHALKFDGGLSWSNADSLVDGTYAFHDAGNKGKVVIFANSTFTANFHHLRNDSSLDSEETTRESMP